MKAIWLVFLLTFLVGCGSTSGTPCETTGSGFTASHNCQHRCLSRTSIFCPSKERILPKVCSGAPDCEPGSCPQGEVCYTINDAFEDVSYCIPETVCGDIDKQELAAWERFTKQLAGQTRLEQELKEQRRRGAATQPKETRP